MGPSGVVEMEHGFISGKRTLKVDGSIIERSSKLLDTGSEHRFTIGSQDCVLRIRSNMGLWFDYELYVSGKLV